MASDLFQFQDTQSVYPERLEYESIVFIKFGKDVRGSVCIYDYIYLKRFVLKQNIK